MNLARFFAATLVSQIGSFIFVSGMLYFPSKSGWTSLQIGLLLGVTHFASLIVYTHFGDIGDRIAPRKLIVTSELAATISSILLILCWRQGTDWSRYLFIIFTGFRSLFVAVQATSKNKYLKLLRSSASTSDRMSFLLVAVNQGAVLFSAIVGYFTLKNFSYDAFIAFDAVTFLMSGLLIFFLPEQSHFSENSIGFVSRLRLYWSVDRVLAFKDLAATIAIMGISFLIIRISGDVRELSFILIGLYGLCFWLAGLLLAKITKPEIDRFVWPMYALSFLFMAYATGKIQIAFGMTALFFCYAILMQKYVAEWQIKVPETSVASVFSVRSMFLYATLGLGELLTSSVSQFASLQTDMTIRALLAGLCSFSIFIFLRKKIA